MTAATVVGAVTPAKAGTPGTEVTRPVEQGGALARPESQLRRGASRADRAYEIRVKAAMTQRMQPLVEHKNNGDEFTYANRIGNYTKGLPHNELGEVDPIAYNNYYLKALRTGDQEDFERIPMGGRSRLTSPQSGLTYELMGMDPANFTQPPPPAFASAEMAAEIAENYWMALCRDINFDDYDAHPLISAASKDLNGFSTFRGARDIPFELLYEETDIRFNPENNIRKKNRSSFPVTPRVLFRGLTWGDLRGPYISQFLWREIQYGAESIQRKIRTAIPGDDYLMTFPEWLQAQRSTGHKPISNRHDPVRRYIRNGRDLGEWVHTDAVVQAYSNAAMILMELGAPEDTGNPYYFMKNQIGFASFGVPHLMSLLTCAAAAALRAVWYQKWFVHRRTRPEEFAARIHNHLTRRADYPVHREILEAAAPQEVFRKSGSYLLPMAYPEGSPTHPAYGSGHAVVAGACITVLKAWFDENWKLPNPVTAAPDGLSLQPYRQADLTVGGELNKLASNIALGRNFAGVHWRSDATDSLRLGEEVVIQMMADMRGCVNERFDGFVLTRFDGQQVAI
jgi:hypothetical protein